jgi:predicted nucleic acid-binding protein
MRIDAVVINASPLITLFRSGQADLLPRLFSHIVVPEAVWQEVVLDEWEDTAARELKLQSWPVREDVTSSPRVAAWELGAGETAVLSHALANPPLRAVIDDMDARRCAITLNIPMLGTGGLLVLAKRRGLLSSVSEGIAKLRDAGLWLTDDIVRILKVQAGEHADPAAFQAILNKVPQRPPLPGDE